MQDIVGEAVAGAVGQGELDAGIRNIHQTIEIEVRLKLKLLGIAASTPRPPVHDPRPFRPPLPRTDREPSI